jgi:hypothetical protein
MIVARYAFLLTLGEERQLPIKKEAADVSVCSCLSD